MPRSLRATPPINWRPHLWPTRTTSHSAACIGPRGGAGCCMTGPAVLCRHLRNLPLKLSRFRTNHNPEGQPIGAAPGTRRGWADGAPSPAEDVFAQLGEDAGATRVAARDARRSLGKNRVLGAARVVELERHGARVWRRRCVQVERVSARHDSLDDAEHEAVEHPPILRECLHLVGAAAQLDVHPCARAEPVLHKVAARRAQLLQHRRHHRRAVEAKRRHPEAAAAAAHAVATSAAAAADAAAHSALRAALASHRHRRTGRATAVPARHRHG
mmetsp:Transcript_12707/g.37236  ORF Transcript_12707/g.37236 Transcript_12707/m.37236 type:complete len:272 (-) Transcript_12707:516-1331(-)